MRKWPPKYAVKYAEKSAKYAEKMEKYAEIKCLFRVNLINFIYACTINSS